MKQEAEKPIALIGAGGHCRSVMDAAESSGQRIGGVIERPGSDACSEVRGYPLMGSDDDVPRWTDTHDFVVTVGAIGNLGLRERLHNLVKSAGGNLTCVIASTAWVSRDATMRDGTVVLHHALVNAGARLGRSVIVNSGAIVEHDCEVGDFTHVSTGAKVNGGVKIGKRVMIGSGATLIQGITVGDDITVGAGSVVTKDLSEPGIYAGVPARKVPGK